MAKASEMKANTKKTRGAAKEEASPRKRRVET